MEDIHLQQDKKLDRWSGQALLQLEDVANLILGNCTFDNIKDVKLVHLGLGSSNMMLKSIKVQNNKDTTLVSSSNNTIDSFITIENSFFLNHTCSNATNPVILTALGSNISALLQNNTFQNLSCSNSSVVDFAPSGGELNLTKNYLSNLQILRGLKIEGDMPIKLRMYQNQVSKVNLTEAFVLVPGRS